MTRQEAREHIKGRMELYIHSTLDNFALHKALEALEQPEQKTGKWVKNENGTWSCSLCQSWIPNEQHYYARYCLYCGAKMEGEQ